MKKKEIYVPAHVSKISQWAGLEDLLPNGSFILNKVFPEFPYEIYGQSDTTKIYILVKTSAPQVTFGTRLVLKWGYGEYNDSRVIRKTNTDLAYSIASSGPWIYVDIDNTIVKYDKQSDNFTEVEDQKHYSLKGYMKLKIHLLILKK